MLYYLAFERNEPNATIGMITRIPFATVLAIVFDDSQLSSCLTLVLDAPCCPALLVFSVRTHVAHPAKCKLISTAQSVLVAFILLKLHYHYGSLGCSFVYSHNAR